MVKPDLFFRAWKYLAKSETIMEARSGKRRLMIGRAFGSGSDSLDVWAQAKLLVVKGIFDNSRPDAYPERTTDKTVNYKQVLSSLFLFPKY